VNLGKKKGDGFHHHLTLFECQMTPLPLFTPLCVVVLPSLAPLFIGFSRAHFVLGLLGALSNLPCCIFIIIPVI
jgi:hypothetical protein